MALIDTVGKVINAGSGVINGVNAVRSLFENRDKQNAKHDDRQVKQQGRLNEVNAKTSKELADYEQKLKMQMWNDTNYKAQVEQAGMAGLSKMAVLGGSGGGSTAQGADVGNVSGSGAADAAATQQSQTMSEMAKAQINNMNADTELKKSQAGKTGQETTNLELDEKWKALDNEMKGRSLEARLQLINGELELQENEIIQSKDKSGQLLSTYVERIAETKAKATQVALQNIALETGTKLDEAKINEISQTLSQKWKELQLKAEGQVIDREWIKNSEENMKRLTETMLEGYYIHGSGNVIGGITDMYKFDKHQKNMKQEGKKIEYNEKTTYDDRGRPKGVIRSKRMRR